MPSNRAPIPVRPTDAQRAAVKALAERWGVSEQDVIRRGIDLLAALELTGELILDVPVHVTVDKDAFPVGLNPVDTDLA